MQSDDFSQGVWLTFTSDHDVEKAIARFKARFDEAPEYVLDDRRFRHPTLKVGPVPGQEAVCDGN